jgi:ferrous iron transport protein B
MIAAFIPYKVYFGLLNLQGLVLTLLYALGLVVAVIVSFVLKKTVFKTERGTFMMEMPSYKVPVLRSVAIRVVNRVKTFVVRAGTVILAITVIIWALSYYPRSEEAVSQYEASKTEQTAAWQTAQTQADRQVSSLLAGATDQTKALAASFADTLASIAFPDEIRKTASGLATEYPAHSDILAVYEQLNLQRLDYSSSLSNLSHQWAGVQIRNSYLGRIGRSVGFLFAPLGWDWKITMAVLASFPAREVIVATLGTIYNLGTDVNEESTSLIDKMRQATWEEGPKVGKHVFTPAVALSIMVFFALCCQCGATLVTIRQETLKWIYPIAVFTYMSILAYVGALVTYQIFSRLGM